MIGDWQYSDHTRHWMFSWLKCQPSMVSDENLTPETSDQFKTWSIWKAYAWVHNANERRKVEQKLSMNLCFIIYHFCIKNVQFNVWRRMKRIHLFLETTIYKVGLQNLSYMPVHSFGSFNAQWHAVLSPYVGCRQHCVK